MPDWLALLRAPALQDLMAWEQKCMDDWLTDVFGFHALQVGGLAWPALRANRMTHQWRARPEYEPEPHSPPDLEHDSRAWPWPADALDLVVLPHGLEHGADPYACLREIERVLIPEGHLLISGFEPLSLWGLMLRGRRPRVGSACEGELIALHRLKDWLRLMGFEIRRSQSFGWSPPWGSEVWRRRWAWSDALGPRWLPRLGGAYMILARKRVAGLRTTGLKPWRVSAPAVAVSPALATSDMWRPSERNHE